MILAQVTYEQLLAKIKSDLMTNAVTASRSTTTESIIPAAWQPWAHWALIVVGILFALMVIFGAFFLVQTQEVKIIERFGKYRRTARAGLNFKVPFIDRVRATLSLKIYQHDVEVDTITKDKVSVKLIVPVQYNVLPQMEADACYKLHDATEQIESFVFDVVRSEVPKMTLDEVFDRKDTIATAVKVELSKDMSAFGYEINRALVTEIAADGKVVAAMNDINAAQREREAANARGEAEKILQVKRAEAQAESDKLRGMGIANQRIEITRGFQKSVEEMKAAAPKAGDDQVLMMLAMTQYFEMLEKVGGGERGSVIMLPHSPAGLTSLREDIMGAILAGKKA